MEMEMEMEKYLVEDSQLTIYLVFTLLSLVVSLVVYCSYQHCMDQTG